MKTLTARSCAFGFVTLAAVSGAALGSGAGTFRTGRPLLLRGVNAASLEWTSDGEGHILKTVDVAIQQWHANIIRLPVTQDRWFGLGPEQHDKGVAYRALVEQVIHHIGDLGAYAILDLHWNDAGVWGDSIGQHVMPDMNSVTFWRDAARTFRNDPAVIFDLYNEPHNITWELWRNGGIVSDNGPTVRRPHKYETPGMQKLLETVRAQGANNLVIAGGLDWAYDMSGFLKGFTLSDPGGNGVIYANHTYTVKGDSITKWRAKIEAAAAKIPVIVSEFGNNAPARPAGTRPTDPSSPSNRNRDWLAQTIETLRKLHLSWVAWDMHPAAGPTLIRDWNYTPTPTFGVLVKQELATPERP
jgi:hypothetical protein